MFSDINAVQTIKVEPNKKIQRFCIYRDHQRDSNNENINNTWQGIIMNNRTKRTTLAPTL